MKRSLSKCHRPPRCAFQMSGKGLVFNNVIPVDIRRAGTVNKDTPAVLPGCIPLDAIVL